MIVTRKDARRIIQSAYGKDFAFKITARCTLGVRPVYDERATLAWRSLVPGSDSAVAIGRVLPENDIDWQFSV